MAKKIVERTLTGTTSNEPRGYEIENRALARKAAADGMVLLKNEGALLPLDTAKPVALYGAGAVVTVKGGTGSGDVNSRETVSIWQGLKSAGFKVTTETWLSAYETAYKDARAAWRDEIWRKADAMGEVKGDGGSSFFGIYSSTLFSIPSGTVPTARAQGDDADTAIFVIARNAGENKDRADVAGDWRLTDTESEILCSVCSLYSKVVLLLNTGGLMDLSFLDCDKMKNIGAVLYIHQPGMEAGNAVADVITGKVSPSAKLTDTWALSYADYPNAATFSHCNGDVQNEVYSEGIYVGYRYFDTFNKKVLYGFGYGLSYTTFAIEQVGCAHYDLGKCCAQIGVKVRVKNTGSASGKEIIQVYASCPQHKAQKEFRRLVGFAKTRLLAAGESEELEVRFPVRALASYCEKLPGWRAEEGKYIILAGSSLDEAKVAGVVSLEQGLIFEKTQNICKPQRDIDELKQDETVKQSIEQRREALLAQAEGKPVISLHEGDVGDVREVVYDGAYDNTPKEVRNFVDTLTTEQLVTLVAGDIKKGQGADEDDSEGGGSQLGSAGAAVPGSAAQTSDCAASQGLSDIVLADGPAGLRLTKQFQAVDGKPITPDFAAALEGGFLVENRPSRKKVDGETRYQWCTAFPVGTQLAQSWDMDLIASVGKAVASELVEFGVTLWLAPGMNIHRNPLCGRNFEYYSEDPVLSGLCAAAMTSGVQSVKGVGTTIKHFACNNQEDNRMASDSILTERTLREIYLKGFQIAVQKSQPMSIMTSYNLINGVHAANNFDTCTKAARCEWGFKGVIMTDWTTTMVDDKCTASGCMRAGNDLVMPGAESDFVNIKAELASGTLKIEDVKRSVARLVNIVWQSRFTQEA